MSGGLTTSQFSEKRSRDVWLLKVEPAQKVEPFTSWNLSEAFFDRHYGHGKPPECFPLIAIGTIFDTA